MDRDRWWVKLEGEKADLHALDAEARVAGCELVADEDGVVHLTSAEVDQIDDYKSVLPAAREKLEILNGLARIRYPDHKTVSVAGTYNRVEPSGLRHHYISVPPTHLRLRAVMDAVLIREGDDRRIPIPPKELRETRISSLEAIPQIKEAVCVFGGEVSWQKLRYVYEIIRQENGGRGGLVTKGWATNEELAQLEANITDKRLSGRDAVHGKSFPHPPAAAPMSLDRGCQLVSRLLRQWIDDVESDGGSYTLGES